MPVGATIGAAVLGAGATVYASSQGSHAQTNAAQTASNDQLRASEENNQLARDMYTANASRLDPYSMAGAYAGDEYLGLLLGPAPAHTPGGSTPNGYFTFPTTTAVPGSSTGGTGSTGPQTLPDVLAMQHDGIPGDYQPALSAYYSAHPPTQAEVDAMKHDGIPHNAAIAQQYVQPTNALAPVVTQQAQTAIAQGADPQAVAARAASMGVAI
jgi:hypothetical protein